MNWKQSICAQRTLAPPKIERTPYQAAHLRTQRTKRHSYRILTNTSSTPQWPYHAFRRSLNRRSRVWHHPRALRKIFERLRTNEACQNTRPRCLAQELKRVKMKTPTEKTQNCHHRHHYQRAPGETARSKRLYDKTDDLHSIREHCKDRQRTRRNDATGVDTWNNATEVE